MSRKKTLLQGKASPLTVRIEESNHTYVDNYAHENRTSIAFIVNALIDKMKSGEVSINDLLQEAANG